MDYAKEQTIGSTITIKSFGLTNPKQKQSVDATIISIITVSNTFFCIVWTFF